MTRPLWRTVLDALVFAAVLLIVVTALDRMNLLNVGTGNATARDGDSLVLNGIEVPALLRTIVGEKFGTFNLSYRFRLQRYLMRN